MGDLNARTGCDPGYIHDETDKFLPDNVAYDVDENMQ